ncbi:MAG: tetratricopeptide repeat protein, partial [Microcoleaceae cyanobacterium]
VDLHQKAELYLAQGKLEEAMAACKQALEIEPNFPLIYKTLGNILQRMGKIDQAKEWYIKAINQQPNWAEIQANLGSLYAQQQQWQLAIKCYQEAIGIKPNVAGFYRNLGKIWQGVGKIELARDCQEQAFSLEAKYPTALEKLKQGKSLLELGEIEEAIANLKQVIELNPSLTGAYQKLGDALVEKGELNQAINCYQRAIQIQPDLWISHHKLGKLFQQIGELDTAIIEFNLAIQLNPKFPWSYKNLGDILQQKGELDPAVKCYKKLTQIKPDAREIQRKINEILLQQQKLDEIIDRCYLALKNDQDLYLSYQILGDVYSKKKEWDEAIKAYHYAIEIEADKDWIYKKLGDALKEKGLMDEAISSYQKAIEINPNSCWHYGALGNIYVQQQKFSQAIPYLMQALKIRPGYYPVHKDILYILKKQGREQEAYISQTQQKLPKDWLKKFFNLTGDWEVTSDDRTSNITRIKIYSATQINLLSPQTIEQKNHSNFPNTKADSGEAFVAIVPEGRGCVYPATTAVITSENKLVRDISTGYAEVIISNSELPPVYYIDGTVAFLPSQWGEKIYFHWMIDTVIRIFLLQKSALKIDKYVFDGCNKRFNQETLKALKISSEQIIKSQFYPHIQAKELVVPSFTAKQDTLRSTKWGCKFLRNLFLTPENIAKSSGKPERIYITRKQASWRRVINEQEVVNWLDQFGFIRITLESMSVAEQVSYMVAAKVIISPHGAGLTNLVFCSQGTKVIEFFSPKYVKHTYWEISGFCGLEYYYFIGEKIESNNSEELPWEPDIIVNIDKLLETIKLAGLN